MAKKLGGKSASGSEAPKRRGRPPKVASGSDQSAAPKRRGRPPKTSNETGEAPKKRGRPPKASAATEADEAPVKRRGRPPKGQSAAEKKPGRPKKSAGSENPTEAPRRRGRPPKSEPAQEQPRSAGKVSEDDNVPKNLSNLIDQAVDLGNQLANNEVLNRYYIGALFRRAISDEAKYGDRASLHFARRLQFCASPDELYTWGQMSAAWSEAQVKKFLKRKTSSGSRIGYSHLALVAGLPDDIRESLLEEVFQNGLTCRALRDRIKDEVGVRNSGAGKAPSVPDDVWKGLAQIKKFIDQGQKRLQIWSEKVLDALTDVAPDEYTEARRTLVSDLLQSAPGLADWISLLVQRLEVENSALLSSDDIDDEEEEEEDDSYDNDDSDEEELDEEESDDDESDDDESSEDDDSWADDDPFDEEVAVQADSSAASPGADRAKGVRSKVGAAE